jgi:methylisocitrate lyase
MQHRGRLYELRRYADYNEFDTNTYHFTLKDPDHDRADR